MNKNLMGMLWTAGAVVVGILVADVVKTKVLGGGASASAGDDE